MQSKTMKNILNKDTIISFIIGLMAGIILTWINLPPTNRTRLNESIINQSINENYQNYQVEAQESDAATLPAAINPNPLAGEMLNQYRIEKGLKPWTHNQGLQNSADESARMIANFKRGWSHDGYVGYISKHYPNWSSLAENLARDFDSFDEVLSAWKRSSTHNGVLLEPSCEYGLGHYQDVWVLHTGCQIVR